MPREQFKATVSVSIDSCRNEKAAIAEASRYLAYADQTDSFGYQGRVFGVNVDANGDWLIELHFDTVIAQDDHREHFVNEMENLAKLESIEQIE